MGLFNKLKNVLFEEEEVDEEVVAPAEDTTPAPKENIFRSVDDVEDDYRPLPKKDLEVKPKEPTFEKIEPEDISERELFRSESTFKFPTFDEDEFNSSMPKLKEDDYSFKKKEEKRSEYSRLDMLRKSEDTKEEKKRFKPSPVISPVYGILDKDYKAEDIVEASKNEDSKILTSKDLDVDSVRAKAFGKLQNNLEKSVRKAVVEEETYEIKDLKKEIKKETPKKVEKKDVEEEVLISDEPILEDEHNLVEERAKTIDELLKDASDTVIDAPSEDIKDDDMSFDDDEIDEIISEEKPSKEILESDTLENDLYDLIDSMYDNTEEGE
jgi:hypothetical protein